MENAINHSFHLPWLLPLQDQWWSKSIKVFSYAIYPTNIKHCKRYRSVSPHTHFIAQLGCFLNVAHLCSDNNCEWVELVMVIWMVWIQCRNWLLGIQAIRDCSSSGHECHGGSPNSWHRRSNFCSDSTRRKGKDGGPNKHHIH